MGLILPKTSSVMSSESGFGDHLDHMDEPALPSSPPPEPPQEQPACSADAYMLNRADFPLRELPKVNGIRDARYQVVFRQSVLDEIHAHGKSSPEAEVCGVLIGDIYSDILAPWAYIEHCIRGNDAVGKQTQVTITSETWTRIHETLERDYPGKKIIGWYHTHPGFGIFLSGMDLFIQDNFFNQPWQIATVYDPHSGDEGTFIWRAGKSVRETSLVENDTGVVMTAASSSGAPSDQIAELTRRVKRLERRLDFLLTGFLFLVLLALTAPLIVFAFAPDTIKNIQIFQRPLFAPKSTPTTNPTSNPAPKSPAAGSSTTTPVNHKPISPARTNSPPDDVESSGSGAADDESPSGPKILTPRSRAAGKYEEVMAQEKLNISWDDLRTRRVDNRLREQGAMERNRTYSQMKEDALPQASAPAGSIWNNAIFCMSLFGLLGGLLAWGAELLVAGPLTPVIGATMHYDPTARADSEARVAEMRQLEVKRDTGQLDATQVKSTLDDMRADGMRNPWFALAMDQQKSEAELNTRRAALTAERHLSASKLAAKKSELDVEDHAAVSKFKIRRMDMEASDRFGAFVMNLLSYGLCGMMLAMCLAIAEPITQRKAREAWINGLGGAGVGVLGGVAAALLIDRISAVADSITSLGGWGRLTAEQVAAWGILGLFLGLGSGLALRNLKKIGVGMLGGLLGGIIGGAIFNPIQNLAHNESIGRLVALIAIGVVAGLATGLLENVVKAGWLKVTSGIIAGKQFILYRNPTYIGSAPDCQIYLFKDNQVGKRHAALHLLATGIEIEDLPLGAATHVNGSPIKRAKLKNGDTIQIGSTSFRFQEKRPAKGT